MSADANFSIKVPLADANRIRGSLARDKERLEAIAKDTTTAPKDRHLAAAEVLEFDRLLRIHF